MDTHPVFVFIGGVESLKGEPVPAKGKNDKIIRLDIVHDTVEELLNFDLCGEIVACEIP